MTKYEWRKKDKDLYLPKKKPGSINVEKFKYFTVEGKGNPNSDTFQSAVESLYSTSYFVRMMHKKNIAPEGYYEYTVFPLEGVWDLDEEGRKLDYLDKDHLVYKLMIRQPEFVNEEIFKLALENVKMKKDNPFLDSLKFEEIEDGLCVQCMHIGSYDNESETFEIMEKYCEENGLERVEKTHKEIYISDPRKSKGDKLKTVLRFKARKIK